MPRAGAAGFAATHRTLPRGCSQRFVLAALCVPPDGEASSAAAAAGGGLQRGAWQLYEKKIALHREQLDGTRRQLDTAVNRLNEMQV